LCGKYEEVEVETGEGILPDCVETPSGAEEIACRR